MLSFPLIELTDSPRETNPQGKDINEIP